MIINKEIPLLTIFSPNKKDVLSSVANPKHAKLTYNFNSCSTLQFQVDKRIMTESGEWIDNPCYNDLSENNLIHMANASTVLNYDGAPLLPDGSYQLKPRAQQPLKYRSQQNWLPFVWQYKPEFVDGNVTLETESLLFDVCNAAGYPWIQKYQLSPKRDQNSNLITQGAGYIYRGANLTNMSIENFFPCKVGDVVFMGSQWDSHAFINEAGGGTKAYAYNIFFYSSASADSCVKYGRGATDTLSWERQYMNPAVRYRIKDGDFGYITYTDANGNTKREYRKEGYIRFHGQTEGGSLPVAGFVYIVDGERRVNYIRLGSKTNHKHSIPWFVIQDVQEVKDGNGVHKTITAYSYEYTLSKHNFSVDESSLPLYIPDEVVNQVTSDGWYIDLWSDNANNVYYGTGAQRMRRGIINQILDYLPDWKIGYISSSALMTKYKPIPKADNVNIYSYLMNEIQKLYGCYIIFDTANMTINLIEQSDIFKYKSGAVISWRNALKALTITNQNTKYITAMKVNCDSDTYGISLVNPCGSNVIYNFDSVLDKMNYSVDDTHINPNTNNPYTLAELVTLWKSTFNSSITSYRSLGNSLIENTKKLETYTELLQVAFAKYQKFVDANNNKVSFQLPNIPQPEYMFSTGDYKCYNGNNDLNYYYATSNDYDDISAANTAYWGFYNTYSATVTAITQTTERMKAIALPLTFNYKTIKKEYDSYGGTANYKPIFTPTEIKELYKFIYEGEWETSIIKFSDDFKPTDIYNSLIDIFTVAKTEMDNIYSKPIYEFSAEIADIFRMEEMRAACSDICLGNSLYIADGDNWIMPVLLQVNVDYDKTNGTTMTFSTDYKRKPLEYRFAKLFATIQQTSVKTSKFTFD